MQTDEPTGRITISRTTSNTREDYVTVDVVTDDGRRVRVELSLDAYALAVTGMDRVPCTVTVERRGAPA